MCSTACYALTLNSALPKKTKFAINIKPYLCIEVREARITLSDLCVIVVITALKYQ